MTQKLSIIIPCYNCATTLRESVASCYTQNLDLARFEIIMVDDGSSDSTRTLMQQLAAAYTNIKLIFHPENRGGGAARNTGIQNSTGELIYCLDSDNVFAPHSVQPMIDFLEAHHLDGVAFYERRFFLGTNLKRFRSQFNTITNRPITLLDIFTETEPLLDNFIYTRAAYLRTAGYPEHHGFDTQCFELRYLTAGNTVRICPDSIFYHRQGMNELSYYERVHASGMFSINSLLIYEELFHLFTPVIQQELIAYPAFTENASAGKNVNDFMRKKVGTGQTIFIENYEQHLIPHGREIWVQNSDQHDIKTTLSRLLFYLFKNEYETAHKLFGLYIATNKNLTPYLAFIELRIALGMAGIAPAKIIKETFLLISQLQVTPRAHGATSARLRKSKLLYPTIRFVRQLFR
jgi:glycosyltransferase involved in cell wall biosynthesis